MRIPGALFLLAVSYSRDIAPIFALHCNSCHGDSGIEGGLITRTPTGLMKAGDAIVPGQPDSSRVVQFIEGRRGEEHRMPLGGAPLSAAQIALIRRWISEGAKPDADTSVKYKLAIPKMGVRKRDALQIECRVPVPAYLILQVRASGRILFERRATIKSLKDRGDAATPGDPVSWTVWPEKAWPSSVSIELDILYAESEPKGASLRAAGTSVTL